LALTGTLIEDEAALGPLCERWDALAVATGSPYSAPAWVLAWWRHVSPDGAAMRVATVEDDGRLVGLAPLFGSSGRGRASYEVMAAQLSPPAGLLVEAGREEEVCAEIGRILAGATPRPWMLKLWERPSRGELGSSLAAGLSRRPAWCHVGSPTTLPVIRLDDGDYEAWLAARPKKFRQEAGRKRRRIDDAGAEFALAEDTAALDAAVGAFERLNAARWRERGGTNAVVPGLREMFRETATELLPVGRLRAYTIKIKERIIAVNILLAAGGEVAGWNSGFDDEWAKFSPSMLLTLHAVADAVGRGDRHIDMGPGEGGYKSRLADEVEEIAQVMLIPRDAGYPLSRLRFTPGQLRGTVGRRLSEEDRARVLRKVRSVTRRGSRR
jgi:CelD/BcsL family acetyltransferase involved in cellulose biosynthesis